LTICALYVSLPSCSCARAPLPTFSHSLSLSSPSHHPPKPTLSLIPFHDFSNFRPLFACSLKLKRFACSVHAGWPQRLYWHRLFFYLLLRLTLTREKSCCKDWHGLNQSHQMFSPGPFFPAHPDCMALPPLLSLVFVFLALSHAFVVSHCKPKMRWVHENELHFYMKDLKHPLCSKS
jgi:hypothetical protein